MWIIHWLSGGGWQGNTFIFSLATVLVVLSFAMMLSTSLAFHRANTTVHPQKFQQVNVLIVNGIFRFSRNPIYLGQLLLLAAWALVLGSWLVWLGWLLFFVYLDYVQVPREERFLTQRFSAEYPAYCQRVRRWL
ncbi:isoprenylcysteine carboxylmethyltransferase family protein [Serratia sp. DD3]|uniref:methyltransferase family protein n=1 Tax=Serratia sp. DD3 TaxID=1410619 RepID=UPI0003C4EDCF|nr:isoprenylcysteine carboxylmethyltransferase family protein [Serratia sp. DD3]